MMQAFLAIGSVWFWLVFVTAAATITYFEEDDNGQGATVALIISLVIFQWGFKQDIIHAVLRHPASYVKLVVLYLALGVLWAVTKWFLFLFKSIHVYRQFKAAFMRERNISTDAVLRQCPKDQTMLRVRVVQEGIVINPEVSDYKGDMVRWMAYWPASVVGFFLTDMVKTAYEAAYAAVAQTMQRVSDRMFYGAKQDMGIRD